MGVDVLLSATTIVTAAAVGRRVVCAATRADGLRVQATTADSLLVVDGPDHTEGPAPSVGPCWVSARSDPRPLIHVSALAGILAEARHSSVYVACLRNLKATAAALALRHRRVAILSPGEGGEVCAADRMAAAWLAARLERLGFGFEDHCTEAEVARWARSDVSLVDWSRSAAQLRKRGRGDDVDFVLRHVDDLDFACGHAHGEVRALRRPRAEATAGPIGWTAPALAGPY